jgi:membrane protein DedA with SNARE-associated domain
MTSYFAEIVNFVGVHPHYAFTAIFLLALSEAIPVIGTVVPGSTLIVGISALATGADVNPWLLLVAAIGGAIAGDGLSFSFVVAKHLSTDMALQACSWLASQPLCAPLFRWSQAS